MASTTVYGDHPAWGFPSAAKGANKLRSSIAAYEQQRSERITSSEEKVRAAHRAQDRRRASLEAIATEMSEPYRNIADLLEAKIDDLRDVGKDLGDCKAKVYQTEKERYDLQRQLDAAVHRMRSSLPKDSVQVRSSSLDEFYAKARIDLQCAREGLYASEAEGDLLQDKVVELEDVVQFCLAELSVEERAKQEVEELRRRLQDERGLGEEISARRGRLQDVLDYQLNSLRSNMRTSEGERRLIAEQLQAAQTALDEIRACKGDKEAQRHRNEIMTLRREVSDVTHIRKELTELRSHSGHLEEQLRMRSSQFEEFQKTFEYQLSREGEIMLRLVTEKEDASKRVRDLEKERQRQADEACFQQSCTKQIQGRLIELQQRLCVMKDVRKLIAQNNSRTRAREGLGDALRIQREDENSSFEQFISLERERFETLQSDNAHLKAVLQEIEPEYQQLEEEHSRVLRLQRADGSVSELPSEASAADRLSLQEAQVTALRNRQAREQLQRELYDVCGRYIRQIEEIGEGLSRDDELETKSAEAQLLMTRIRELVTVYVPVKSDPVDNMLAHLINTTHPPVPFFRLSAGVYLFGSRRFFCKLGSHGKLVFRVGGGFCSFEEFLEGYASEELAKLETAQVNGRGQGFTYDGNSSTSSNSFRKD